MGILMEKKIPCEIYSRVVGYMRPLQQWNLGKKEEFQDRNQYKQEEIFKSKKFTEENQCRV
jgi:ribonucleoside-triphosphate reductase